MDQLRVCAKIDLDALTANIRIIHEALGGDTKPGIFAVIKADAYGHGALPLARYMERDPYISGFAVATFEEAKINDDYLEEIRNEEKYQR